MVSEELEVDRKLPILRKSRYSTGISNLDILLEGGYLKGALVLLVGPTGMEKNAFSFHFVDSALKSGELVLYITTDTNHEEILKKADSLEFSFRSAFEKNELIFLDCYSSTLGASLDNKESSKNIITVPGPSALNDLSLAIRSVLEQNPNKPLRVVFHTLSSLVLYNPEDTVIKFIQFVGGRLKQANASTLFLVEEGMHNKQLLASLEHLMDEIYRLKDGDTLRIEGTNIPSEIPLKLGKAGIELV